MVLRTLALGIVFGLSVAAGRAQEADPTDVNAGMRLFQSKGNCNTCHGWAGDGRKMDTQMPDGANLRETTLDRETVVKTIQCGRPGSGMPAFDRLAYSDGRCYGMKKADLDKAELALTDPPATLAAREINLIADFLFAKVVGKGPMTKAGCIAFWGGDVAACEDVPP
jgi:hypothetical protein